MEIYSFTGKPVPHRIDNAAPVFTATPQAYVTPVPAVTGTLQLIEQDTFTRSGSGQPVMPSFLSSVTWLNKHTPADLTQKLNTNLATATKPALGEAASLLFAASRNEKIEYTVDKDAELRFGKNYRLAVSNLEEDDTVGAAFHLRRALRFVKGFINMAGEKVQEKVQPLLPRENPFKSAQLGSFLDKTI